MRRILIVAAIVAAGLAASVALEASYLEEDEAAGEDVERLVPPPRPVPGNPLTDLIQRISVRPAYTYKGLTVFLLETPRVTDPTDYMTMTEALERETLSITEKGGGSVPVLLARNTGRRPVLMLAGEIVVGGKQNRTLRDDVLLPPRSDQVELPVYCVEQGRWTGASMEFGTKSALAAPNVRAGAVQKRPQAEIWASVSDYNASLGVQTASGDLQTALDSERVKEAQAEYREAFGKHWRPRAVGMVIARWGRIVAADVFCNPGVFRKHRDRLLDSYVVDCIAFRRDAEEPDERMPRAVPSPDDAARFLRRALRAEFEWRSTPGSGRLLDFSGRGISGAALVQKEHVLHACLLPDEVAPVIREPRPLILQERQQGE